MPLRHPRAIVVCLTIALSMSSCERGSTEVAAPVASPPATEAPSPVSNDETSGAPRPLESIGEADVRELFDQWLAAQNDGDFDAYAGTYATKFEGIKRVGPKTFKYDHEGWLADRKRMFRKKMTVTADDVEISTSARAASVRFAQTWASGTYEDRGPKMLVLSLVDDELRITREEMLESHVTGSDAKVPPYRPAHAALVVSKGATVVLDLKPTVRAAGPPQPGPDGYSAVRAIDVAASGYGAWKGRRLKLFDAAGEACDATIDDVKLMARVIPHFADEQHWRETNATAEQVAAQVWTMGAEDAVVVGELDRACPDAVWAREAEGRTRPISRSAPDDALVERLHREIAKLPGYRSIQKENGGKKPWHTAEGALFAVEVFGDFVSASAMAGAGCGDFYGEFWAIWRREGSNLVLLSDGKDPGPWFHPRGAAMLESNEPRFFGADEIAAPVEGTIRATHEATVPYLDCPC